MLGAERPETARRRGRRGDRGPRPRGMDFLDPACDELVANRLLVRGGQHVVDGVVGRVGDSLEDPGRVVVARLDALEVQDREAADPGESTRESRIDDGIHCRGEDRDVER